MKQFQEYRKFSFSKMSPLSSQHLLKSLTFSHFWLGRLGQKLLTSTDHWHCPKHFACYFICRTILRQVPLDPHFIDWKLGTEKSSSIWELTQHSWDSNPYYDSPILSTRSPYCFSKVGSNPVTNLLSCPSGPLA